MKKKMIVLVLAMVMAFSLAVPSFAASAADTPRRPSATLLNTQYIDVTSSSGITYRITVASDRVGYNYITTGYRVAICQAYCTVLGCNPGDIDSIWGNNSETALRSAQTKLNKYYSQVTSDGICGSYTWRGFYSRIDESALANLV